MLDLNPYASNGLEHASPLQEPLMAYDDGFLLLNG